MIGKEIIMGNGMNGIKICYIFAPNIIMIFIV